MNCQQRGAVKKTEDTAVMVDRFTSALIIQRRSITALEDLVRAVLDAVQCQRTAATAIVGNEGADDHANTPPVEGAVEEAVADGAAPADAKDALWVVEQRPVLITWMKQKNVHPGAAGEVGVDMPEVNTFLEKCVAGNMDIDQRDAVRMLERRWQLATRARRNSAAPSVAAVGADATTLLSNRPGTDTYQDLHQAVSHIYQRIGDKAVTAFASYINEHEQVGILRRGRGTRSILEVIFSAQDAGAVLHNDALMTEFRYRAGVVHALSIVFSVLGEPITFSRPPR